MIRLSRYVDYQFGQYKEDIVHRLQHRISLDFKEIEIKASVDYKSDIWITDYKQ